MIMRSMRLHANHRWPTVLIVLVVLVALLQFPNPGRVSASFPATLAYFGNDGNVYLLAAGSDQPTPLTNDGNLKATPLTHYYTHLTWSPDGTRLAFQDGITHDLYVATLGKPYQRVASDLDTEYPPAWLPDGSAIAYVVNSGQTAGGTSVTMEIHQVSPDGGQANRVATFVENQGCGGGGGDPASFLYTLETAMNGNALTFAWTKGGWLYSPSCTGMGIALLNASSQILWKANNIGRLAVSPSGARAAGIQFGADQKPSALVYLDLTTGLFAGLNTSPSIDQVGWSADETTLLYSTIDGQNVTLWKIAAQGGPVTSLFSDQGRYIGVITTTPDSSTVVFSDIPTGDNPQTQLLSVPLSATAPVNRSGATPIAQGGRPAFSHAAVSVPTPTPAPTVATVCTPRTDWAFTYTVVAGDTLSSIARRTGTTVDVLAAGNCLANTNAIFTGQVLRVPASIQALPPGTRRIQFQTGTFAAVVQGQVAASGTDTWVLRAQAGQTLTAQLAITSGQAILIVWGADGNVLMSDHAGASSFTGVLPTTQDYFIAVRGNPNTATSYSLTVTVPPLSVPPPAATRIQFATGTFVATVQGQVAAGGSAFWVLRAQAGQTLTAQLTSSTGQATLMVWGADGNVLLPDQTRSSSFSGVLPTTQDYFIAVRSNSNSAASYSLTVTVPPLSSAQPTARRIQFQPGSALAVVQGQLSAGGMDRWVLRALAGQSLLVDISSSSGSAILIIFGADGNVLLSDHAGATSFTGVLPTTQDYFIDVRGNPNSATTYTLSVTVPPR